VVGDLRATWRLKVAAASTRCSGGSQASATFRAFKHSPSCLQIQTCFNASPIRMLHAACRMSGSSAAFPGTSATDARMWPPRHDGAVLADTSQTTRKKGSRWLVAREIGRQRDRQSSKVTPQRGQDGCDFSLARGLN